ncbi:hypothetical protein C8R44DRAFT_867297 [Mycena epipterygia]|nr:hypothetical protein C8R44DRAFT_867297 [Mycena epipterygia]
MPPPTNVYLEDFDGILRLSHKYDVPHLYRRALQHLSTLFHFTSVHDYRSRPHASIYFPQPASYTPQLLHLIAAVIQVSAEWLLPMIYYDTSMNNGTSTSGLFSLLDSPSPSSAAWIPAIQKCIIAQEALFDFRMVASSFLSALYPPCIISADCYRTRLQHYSLTFKTKLCAFKRWGPEWWEELAYAQPRPICSSCRESMRENHREDIEDL